MFLPHPRVKVSIVGSLRDREVACSASDRQGSNFDSCVWRTLSSQSSHHPQEVLLAQFSLYVHKGGLRPDSFHFYDISSNHNSFGGIFQCQCDKSVYLSTYLTDLYNFCVISYRTWYDRPIYIILMNLNSELMEQCQDQTKKLHFFMVLCISATENEVLSFVSNCPIKVTIVYRIALDIMCDNAKLCQVNQNILNFKCYC